MQLDRLSRQDPAQRNTRYDILRVFDDANAKIDNDFVMQN